MPPVELLIIMAAAGVAAGVASGLFGIGGGVLIVPVVLFLTPFSFREAVAVSLLVIAVTSPVGVFTHHRARNVRWRTGLLLGGAGFAGVLTAQVLDPLFQERHLVWAFAAFLVYASNRLAYGTRPLVRLHGPTAILAVGFVAGAVAKFFGIGGGILMVPTLVFLGLSIHVAVATSLVAVFTNAALSTANNLAFLHPLDWAPWAVPVAAGSWFGTWLGSRASVRSHAGGLRRAFAVLLLVVTLLLLQGGSP